MTAVTVITMSRDELAHIISEAVQSGIERATQKTGERWGVADLARHYRVCEATIRKRRMAYLDKEHALIAARHIFGLKGGEL